MTTPPADELSPSNGLPAALEACRPGQWPKNALVALPLLAAHGPFTSANMLAVALTFLAFCLIAASTYLVNDVLDVASDRTHPSKRRRPIASGRLSVGASVIASSLLSAGAGLIAILFLPLEVLLWLLGYALLATAYSVGLKRVLLVDVFVLAALYVARLFAGGAAVDVELSPWLVGCAGFFFLGLAFLKRYGELRARELGPEEALPGRPWSGRDLEVIRVVGPVSGYLAALVLVLYVNGETARQLYARPELLWLAVPALLYWITRMWLLAHRGVAMDDPLAFALRDPPSYAVLAWMVAAGAVAS